MRRILFGLCAIALIGLTSCAGSDTPEGVREGPIEAALPALSRECGLFTPFANIGYEVGLGGVSSKLLNAFRYAVGSEVRVPGPLTLAVEFFGRVPFSGQFQGEHDLAIGLQVNPLGNWVVEASLIRPLSTGAGLRTDVTWGLGVQYSF